MPANAETSVWNSVVAASPNESEADSDEVVDPLSLNVELKDVAPVPPATVVLYVHIVHVRRMSHV